MSEARRDELILEGETHPRPEELARLLEPDVSQVEAAPLRDHLLRCRRCFALHAEMTEIHLRSRWRPDELSPPADLLVLAHGLAARPSAVAKPFRALVGDRERRSGVPALAAAAAALTLIALLIGDHRDREGGTPSLRAHLETIRVAIADASRVGMVLTPDVAAPAPPRRAAAVANEAALATALTDLSRTYDVRPTESNAYWLAAGMLAEGDPGAATILSEAQRLHPRSLRIANLVAVSDYRANRLAESESTLRAILERRPRDEVALFNLGVLMSEQGRRDELAKVRRRLESAHVSGAMRQRASVEFGDSTP